MKEAYVVDSELVGNLDDMYRGNETWILLKRSIRSSTQEPSYEVVSPTELRAEEDALDGSMDLNAFRYGGVNQEFKTVLRSVARDCWETVKPPRGIGDVDNLIVQHIERSQG